MVEKLVGARGWGPLRDAASIAERPNQPLRPSMRFMADREFGKPFGIMCPASASAFATSRNGGWRPLGSAFAFVTVAGRFGAWDLRRLTFRPSALGIDVCLDPFGIFASLVSSPPTPFTISAAARAHRGSSMRRSFVRYQFVWVLRRAHSDKKPIDLLLEPVTFE